MRYIRSDTLEFPLDFDAFQQYFPNASVPLGGIEPFFVVVDSEQPSFNRLTQQVREDNPALVKGVWTQKWEVIEIFGTEAERLASIAAGAAVDKENAQAAIFKDVQLKLDQFAKARGYDSILSACSYAGSSIKEFAAEGAAAVLARDGMWAAVYQVVSAVDAGTRPPITEIADIDGELPVLTW